MSVFAALEDEFGGLEEGVGNHDRIDDVNSDSWPDPPESVCLPEVVGNQGPIAHLSSIQP